MSTIFNSDAWKKAVDTFKTKKGATQALPTAAVGALSGVSQMPKQPLPTGLPPAAIQAAKNVKSGVPSVPTVPTAATTAAQKMVTATAQPRTEQALSAQANLVNTPFTYNADSDPAYQAALRAAQQNLSVNQKNTNAQLRATGQGKSSYSETVANQLANQSAENIANNILPQYAQQAYAQYKDSIGNQRNLYQDYNQQDFQNPITEAATTGNYMPAEAKAAYDQIIANKQAAESPTITRQDRTAISSETDKLRDTLKRLGIDISGLGADKTAAQASTVNPGIRTLAGKQTDETIKQNDIQNKQFDRQQNFNEGITMAGLTGQINGKPTTTEQQRQLTNLWTAAEQIGTIPDTLADMYGIPRGTQTQTAKQFAVQMENESRGLDISQQNADTSRTGSSASIANSQFGQLMDVWQATGAAPAGLESFGVKAGTAYTAGAASKAADAVTAESYATSYIDKSVQRDPDSGDILNLDAVKAQILQSGLPDSEIAKLYSRYGIPLPAGYLGN